MSDPFKSGDGGLQPQVITTGTSRNTSEHVGEPLAPRIIPTVQTGRLAPARPTEAQPDMQMRKPRRSLVVRLGFAGLALALIGWLGVDLYLWIESTFRFSSWLGWTATAAVAAGVIGAVAIILHEMRGYFALKKVEANHQYLEEAWDKMRPAAARDAIGEVISGIAKDSESEVAIEAFQGMVRSHHSAAQQLELFSQTVMSLFDQRAEAIVRRAGARAFGITALSPTAITDALFFVACSVRMVREIATCYGHRPTTLATVHLLRRLLIEGGKLGAVDLAGATLTQHIGGAVAERITASAAESVYAAQRMARLGLVTMNLCRPVPFRKNELPGIFTSLFGKLFTRLAEVRQTD